MLIRRERLRTLINHQAVIDPNVNATGQIVRVTGHLNSHRSPSISQSKTLDNRSRSTVGVFGKYEIKIQLWLIRGSEACAEMRWNDFLESTLLFFFSAVLDRLL
jgi:hypothetical protein